MDLGDPSGPMIAQELSTITMLLSELVRMRDDRRFQAAVAFGAALVGRDDSVAWMQELFEERATKQQACEELADAAVRFADALLDALDAPAGEVAP